MDDFYFNVTATVNEYEVICASLLANLEPPIQDALAETGLSPKYLISIELVGDGSRVECIKRTLAKIIGLDESDTNNRLSNTTNSDEAVARGAALRGFI